jgi:hypothetical protein
VIIGGGGVRRQFDLRASAFRFRVRVGMVVSGLGGWFMAPQIADHSAKDQDGGHQAGQRDPGKEVVGGHWGDQG